MLLLDGVLSNFLNYMLGDISIFNPLLTIVTIIMIYPYFKKDENKYFITSFILGFLYDLFYYKINYTIYVYF